MDTGFLDNVGTWVRVLASVSASIPEAVEAKDLLKSAQEDDNALSEEQRTALNKLPKDAPPDSIMNALGFGSRSDHNSSASSRGGDGGAGGNARSWFGSATGGAGGHGGNAAGAGAGGRSRDQSTPRKK